jgi:transcriptional regulator with PAS, ATPase and Fis domain
MLDKIGSTRTTPVDFRLVAATNRNIPELIKRRRFRDDLFYRLNTMMVEIPTLSERREDIPLLVNHYLQTMGRLDLQVSDEAWQAFNNHDWPGNIRELKNVINRAVSLTDGNTIEMSNLPDNMHHSQKPESQLLQKPNGSLADEMVAHEKKLLADRLEECGHNMAKTARSLHISRSTLYEKCRRHNLIQPAG